MTDNAPSLSRDDFDRVIERAMQLDEARHDRVALDQACAIANELGISTPAWNAALEERGPLAPPLVTYEVRALLRGRVPVVALVGLITGTLAGAVNPQASDGALVLGGAAIAAAVALVMHGLRRQSMRTSQLELAAWWLAIPIGIMLGMRELHLDPMAFAAISWAGCSAFAFAVDRWIRRAPPRPALIDAAHERVSG